LTAPAWGSGTGNRVNNCYGIYFTRDWNQDCNESGATQEGDYKSTANCNNSGDHDMTKYRFVGSLASYDGEDCTFSVTDVDTWFQ